MISKLDAAFAYQANAVGLRAHRQQVLAGNIANADTPHFKARDFDFASVLKDAVAGRGRDSLSMKLTNRRHLEGSRAVLPARLDYRTPSQDSVDGNTVDMDIERGLFAENAIHYEAGLSFLTHQVKMLLAATQSN
ncbi:MAG: flagellar basal body rod protein FlgB [Candidatus Accumulibacter sp.]|jgi:flagellar basal-body rod protein FlgB|nr:flagellar basal body rod protein FlgB [Accumulibacter sp.]